MLKAISHTQHYLGEFGNSSQMKNVANLLIASHNVATAEFSDKAMDELLESRILEATD